MEDPYNNQHKEGEQPSNNAPDSSQAAQPPADQPQQQFAEADPAQPSAQAAHPPSTEYNDAEQKINGQETAIEGHPTEDEPPSASNVYITAVNLPPEGENEETKIFKAYSQEEIENFKCIFDMFDQQKSGFVEVTHLQTILKCLGRDPSEVGDLVKDLNPDQNQLSFQEFLVIMRQLENRLVQGQQEGDAQGADAGDENMPLEATLEERNKYGPLLPRTGVHFLPDSKVVDFLKLLNDYRRKCCNEMNLPEARRAQLKFEDLKNKEMLRQLQNMRQAQEQELVTVEAAQRNQFLEFSNAWDNYMSDYEATAYLSLEKLKEKHQLEIQQLHERIRAEHSAKVLLSRQLMEMKDKTKKLTFSKRYEEAELLQLQCQQLEQNEYEKANELIEEIIEKQEALLRQKQQQALSALLKRIQRDRNEQLKHRQIDSQRLIQRNKNLLLDLLNKQNQETRRTNNFLRMALGTRSPGKPKYFKSKFHENYNAQNTRLSFPEMGGMAGANDMRGAGLRTAAGGDRSAFRPLSHDEPRAQTTNQGQRTRAQ